MCLIFLAINQHPSYKLLIAANRDEFYQRKTAAAHFWEEHPHILGGRDLEASGTWLGITRTGRISLVTNYRDLRNLKQVAPSRGQLVADFLNSDHAPQHYLTQVATKAQAYNGFNLITGSVSDLWYYSNYEHQVKQVEPGIHGLSNALLNTPWPKVERGKVVMQQLASETNLTSNDLFEFLKSEEQAPDEHLPDTGIGIERERALSSMFIKSPGYGTRCSTVVMVDQQNEISFSERVYDLSTFKHTTRTFRFKA